MATSQNGWTANNPGLCKPWTIRGTDRIVRLNKGDAGFLLVDFAAWFDKHVESIDGPGVLDDWGYAERKVRGGEDLSNHASGTALDLNATKHPLGKTGTFTVAQHNAIRDRLKVYDGAIRWGGDYKGRKDEMHFEINASAAKVARVAKKLRAVPAKPTHDTGVTQARALLIAEGVKAGPVRRLKIRAALAALPKW